MKIYAEYIVLLKRFVRHEISAETFQDQYLNRFKDETRFIGGEAYELLQEAFGDVDSFSADPLLLEENPSFYLNELQLREKVQKIIDRLNALPE
jgi:hypothetical protein